MDHLEQMNDLSSNALSSQPAHIATQEEKLNAIFGITGGKSVDEFLDSLSLDDNNTSAQLSAFDQSMKNKISELDQMSIDLSAGGQVVQLQMKSMEHSLEQVEELVNVSKDIIKHVAQSILATPLIDSEAVQAYSSLIECIRISIDEFIGVYRDKINFINKVKFEMLKLSNAKELALYKHNLALEAYKAKAGPEIIDAESCTTSQNWSQEDAVKFLNDNGFASISPKE